MHHTVRAVRMFLSKLWYTFHSFILKHNTYVVTFSARACVSQPVYLVTCWLPGRPFVAVAVAHQVRLRDCKRHVGLLAEAIGTSVRGVVQSGWRAQSIRIIYFCRKQLGLAVWVVHNPPTASPSFLLCVDGTDCSRKATMLLLNLVTPASKVVIFSGTKAHIAADTQGSTPPNKGFLATLGFNKADRNDLPSPVAMQEATHFARTELLAVGLPARLCHELWSGGDTSPAHMWTPSVRTGASLGDDCSSPFYVAKDFASASFPPKVSSSLPGERGCVTRGVTGRNSGKGRGTVNNSLGKGGVPENGPPEGRHDLTIKHIFICHSLLHERVDWQVMPPVAIWVYMSSMAGSGYAPSLIRLFQ